MHQAWIFSSNTTCYLLKKQKSGTLLDFPRSSIQLEACFIRFDDWSNFQFICVLKLRGLVQFSTLSLLWTRLLWGLCRRDFYSPLSLMCDIRLCVRVRFSRQGLAPSSIFITSPFPHRTLSFSRLPNPILYCIYYGILLLRAYLFHAIEFVGLHFFKWLKWRIKWEHPKTRKSIK